MPELQKGTETIRTIMQVKIGHGTYSALNGCNGHRFMNKSGKGTAFVFAFIFDYLPQAGSLCLGGEGKGPTNQ